MDPFSIIIVGEFSITIYTLSSAKTAVASDYLYVKTQSFTTAGFSFDWEHAPYHTGSSSSTGFTKYIPTAKSSYWSGSGDPDNKLVLDPEDDAATVNWGPDWRMPTSAEFNAMKNATYWAWDSADQGYYVFEADATHAAGARVSSIPGDLNKADALLFFPAAGYGYDASLREACSYGLYWSCSLYSSDPYSACLLYFYGFYGGLVSPQRSYGRYYGQSVRPLSD